MTLHEQIKADYITAFKAKKTQAKDALANLKAAIENWVKLPENVGKELTDADVLAIIRSQSKKLQQTLSYIKDPTTSQLAIDTAAQLAVIEQYKPKQLTEEEITGIIIGNLLDTIPDTMRFFKFNYEGQYDNKLLKSTFEKLLTTRKTEL